MRFLLLFGLLYLSLNLNAQNITKKCKTCNKTIAECRYGGEHPQCKTCKKIIDNCRYKGNHPKCNSCGKVIDYCSYKGKHPIDTTLVTIDEMIQLNMRIKNIVQDKEIYYKSRRDELRGLLRSIHEKTMYLRKISPLINVDHISDLSIAMEKRDYDYKTFKELHKRMDDYLKRLRYSANNIKH